VRLLVAGTFRNKGSLVRKILSLILAGSAFMAVPSAASATIVKGDHSDFAREWVGTSRDVNVYHGDTFINPDGSVTVGADPSHHPDPHPSVVPEPATWAMLILGFGTIGFAVRRRQRSVFAQIA
jgi:PEP-CTERM motif